MSATAGMIFTMGDATAGFAAQQQQARALSGQAKFETRLADLDAADAIARGDQAASVRTAQARRTVGAQRAIQAASGIDANSGTAVDLQADEMGIGALDAQTIRNNAAREAWGYRTQASLNATGLENEASSLRTASYSTLLTGAAKTYGLYRANRSTLTTRKPSAMNGSPVDNPLDAITRRDPRNQY